MKDLEQEESLAEWLPSALLFILLVIGLVLIFGVASCAKTAPAAVDAANATVSDDAGVVLAATVKLYDGFPACKTKDPQAKPGSCSTGATAHYYCTICIADEKCISPKSTYCVARALGCDDPACKVKP